MANSSSDYRALKKLWYKKLKETKRKSNQNLIFLDDAPEDEYFKDIERNEYELKRPSEFVRERYLKSWQSKETYYYAANHFLNEYKFVSALERIIWEYHSNGISGRNIAKTLTKTRRRPINRMTVWRIVKRLNKEMKKLYPHIYGNETELK